MQTDKIISVSTIVATIVIIGGGVFFFANQKPPTKASRTDIKPEVARTTCVQHGPVEVFHIHPHLEIFIEGKAVTIPENTGISPSCMMALHTHDDSGTIHIEYPRPYDFTLGDFFADWGQTLSKDQLMDKKVDDSHTLRMEVDNKPSTEFENLILKDDQKIVLRYEKKKT